MRMGKKTYTSKYEDWQVNTTQEWKACTRVGLIHHVLVAIHESVLVLKHTFDEHRQLFPDVAKRRFGSPGYSTLLLHSVWTAFFDRCLIKLPTSEYVSPQFGGSWTLESSSLCHHPTVIIALNRTIRDGSSYVNCLTPIPEEWLVERDWLIVNIGKISSVVMFTRIFVNMLSSNIECRCTAVSWDNTKGMPSGEFDQHSSCTTFERASDA